VDLKTFDDLTIKLGGLSTPTPGVGSPTPTPTAVPTP
jgi:hypothetical protein